MINRYPVLDEVTRSADALARLDRAELSRLCAEIRAFLIENIAKTGGHLASNLGIVEISVALALEFDPYRDRILYDVGHQCYVHKLLTGRREGFETLRTTGGMSGFPRPWESTADPFVAGHASNALSAAAGLARARTLDRADHRVVAVVGDGALTGGMTMEALNDIGRGEEPLIVILNDNGMAISKSVGSIANYLNRIRTRPSYYRFKTFVERSVSKRFGGFLKRLKRHVKTLLLPASIIESLGFSYLGPVDGHDIAKLRDMISFAKLLNRPVVIHCVTVKGRGAEYAEQEPDRYHGAPAFDAFSGAVLTPKRVGFSDVFGETMCALARDNRKLCAITAAMPTGTGLAGFAHDFPARFFDVGIAEQHAVTMAAGLAKGGYTPVCAIYSTFLQRAYDQILHDVCIDPVHVVFAIDRAGLVPGDGETHQGLFDVSYLAAAPGMTVYAPSNLDELSLTLRRAILAHTGPIAVRYPRGSEGECRFCDGADAAVIAGEDGGTPDATIVCYGTLANEALLAAASLACEGKRVRVVKILRILPIPPLAAYADAPMVFAEEAARTGSIGERVLAKFAEEGICVRAKRLDAGERFLPCGDLGSLRRMCGLDAESIADAVRGLL
ncbi:MAG: 1-deoxy-D-xylulose-5-phosphate synthase [Clostridiaceae bacterium]|nr:1-deoxy-D-xylulose-5-phosphate synthase [Clostridiaceae bacterium]